MLRNVVDIFRDILERRQPRADAGARQPSRFPGAFCVKGDEGRLGQVLTNLIDNAISFSPEDGTVTVQARAAAAEVEIVVEDEGPGIPEDQLEIIFDRFYSDRPADRQRAAARIPASASASRARSSLAHGGQIFAENRYAGWRRGRRQAVRGTLHRAPADRRPGATRRPRPVGDAA